MLLLIINNWEKKAFKPEIFDSIKNGAPIIDSVDKKFLFWIIKTAKAS